MIGFVQHGRFHMQQVCIKGGNVFGIVCLQTKDVRGKSSGSQPVLCDILHWHPLDSKDFIDVLPYHAPNIQMLRAKLVKLDTYGISHISGVMLVAYLIMGWSRPAFSAEPAATPDEQPHLQLAPIDISHSVGGYLGYIYDRTATGAISTNQQTLYVGVNGNVGLQSFFWQPWFAKINANLSANVNSARTSSSTSPVNTVSEHLYQRRYDTERAEKKPLSIQGAYLQAGYQKRCVLQWVEQ